MHGIFISVCMTYAKEGLAGKAKQVLELAILLAGMMSWRLGKLVLDPWKQLRSAYAVISLECGMQAFDTVVEASGSSQGIKLASAMTRPMGSIVLKSTCSAVNDAAMPAWSDIANDVVVNEKRLQGSRCASVSTQQIADGMPPNVPPELSNVPACLGS